MTGMPTLLELNELYIVLCLFWFGLFWTLKWFLGRWIFTRKELCAFLWILLGSDLVFWKLLKGLLL